MKNKFIILIIVMITILTAVICVSANLGNFNQGACVPIRILANCSTVNITEVSNINTTFIINKPMTNLGGQTFNYTFCNTTTKGTYTYSWNNPCIDCSQGQCGNSFEIGNELSIAQAIIYFIALMIAIGIFIISGYFAINLPFKNTRDDDNKIVSINKIKYLKLFLIPITYLLGLLIIGITLSITTNFLFLNGISQIFNWVYWIMMSLLVIIVPVLFVGVIMFLYQDQKLRKKLKRGFYR